MSEPKFVLRILDANLNRAREALRVSEDTARFYLGCPSLAQSLKSARHQITRGMLKFPVPYAELIKARDSVRDIGKESQIQDKKRVFFCDLFISNMKRAQEALRVIEECARIFGLHYQRPFQKIRFDLYELEKQGFQKF